MAVSDAVLARYKRQIARYRAVTSAALVTAWDQLSGWDAGNVEEYAAATAAALEGGKAASVSLSSAVFALMIEVPPVGVSPGDVDVTPDIRGPFRATWHARLTGRPELEALRVGRSTAQAVGFDFIQSTARRTGDRVADLSGVEVRWNRSPGAKSCDWCRLVATQLYRTAESADFGHERDDCDVIPVLL